MERVEVPEATVPDAEARRRKGLAVGDYEFYVLPPKG
jgi:hypothetical protein